MTKHWKDKLSDQMFGTEVLEGKQSKSFLHDYCTAHQEKAHSTVDLRMKC